MGITGNMLPCLQLYLTNRSQMVIIDGSLSSVLSVTFGVLQRSLLSHLLFTIFFNDLPNCASCPTVPTFADDTNCIQSINSHLDHVPLFLTGVSTGSFPSTTLNANLYISTHLSTQSPLLPHIHLITLPLLIIVFDQQLLSFWFAICKH